MSNKVPVVSTATQSIVYSGKNILRTIKLFWVGAVLWIALYAMFFWQAFFVSGVADAVETGDAVDFPVTFIAGFFLVMLAAQFFFTPGSARFARIQAGDLPSPRGFGYFKYESRDWLYLAGGLIMAAIYCAVFMIPQSVLFMGPTDPVGPGNSWLMVAPIVFLVVLILYAWFLARACTFLPMIAIEGRFSLRAALSLTKGNVWRIVGSFVLLYVMAIALYMGIFIGLMLVTMVVMVPFAGFEGTDPGVFTTVLLSLGGLAAILIYIAMISFLAGAFLAFPNHVYLSLTRRGNMASTASNPEAEAGEAAT